MSTSTVTAAVADLLTIAPPLDAPSAVDRETPLVRALVSAAQAGDAGAFGQLVAMHERVVYRTSLAALGRREDAEDAAQDAFVLAWRKLSGFRGDSTFRTWLLTIVWRRALDKRRVRWRLWSRASSTSHEIGDLTDFVPDAGADPERRAIARDLARRIAVEIGRLSPKLRDTLLLAATGAHTYDEIGAMLGVPVGTVKWRVSEARRVVTAALGEAGGR